MIYLLGLDDFGDSFGSVYSDVRADHTHALRLAVVFKNARVLHRFAVLRDRGEFARRPPLVELVG
jgi:hypothetical protein